MGRLSGQPSCHRWRPGGFSWPTPTPAAGHSLSACPASTEPRVAGTGRYTHGSLLNMDYREKKKKANGYMNRSLGDLALEVSHRETNHTNVPFKAWLSPWPTHSGHPWRPERGSCLLLLTAPRESSFHVPGSSDIQQQPQFPGLWEIWQQA